MSCQIEKVETKDCEFYTTPLEESLPGIFEEYDENQKLLKESAKPVILIENATEIFNRIKDLDGFFEQIIEIIINENKSDYNFIGSYSLQYYIKPETISFAKERVFDNIKKANNKDIEEYETEISKIKEKITKKDIVHVSANFGFYGGHYGILIRNKGKVVLFDSMQKEGWGVYTAFFSQICKDIFGVYPETIENKICPQPTGGFVELREGETESEYIHRIQDMDSQNHFCHFWSIWYFNLFISNKKSVHTTFSNMEKYNHPLVIIKRYIWAILHYFYSSKENLIELLENAFPKANKKELDFILKFFLIHFRYVWDNCETKEFQLYCIIPKGIPNITSINDCLSYSLEKTPYILDKNCIENIKEKSYDSYDMWLKEIKKDPLKFKVIPDKFKTPEMYKEIMPFAKILEIRKDIVKRLKKL